MSSSKKRPFLCPNCRKLISADEPRCPYCGISSPGSPWRSNFLTRLFSRPDELIRAIIFTNAGMYILTILFSFQASGISLNRLTFLSPDNTSLMLLGATGTFPIDRLGRWWTLLSANYLHGGIFHLLFNMFAFWQLAPLVFREYGNSRTFLIYTLGGVTGFLISYFAGVTFTIGASAALCSLIGAVLYYGKSRGGLYGHIIYRQIGTWAISIFIFGFLIRGINNWAHGGGMLAGLLLGAVLGYSEKKVETPLHQILAIGCGMITVLTLIWAVFSAIYYLLRG